MNNKILVIIPSFDSGGVEKSLINIANGLSFTEEVTILSCVDTGSFRSLVSENVEINVFPVKKLRSSFILLFKYLKKNNFDLVISGPTFVNLAVITLKVVLRCRFKLLATHHNFQDVEMKNLGLKGKLMPLLTKFLYPFSDYVIAVSNGVKQQLVNQFDISENKVKVIYNPILDIDFYNRSKFVIKDFSRYETLPFVLFIGRLEVVKNCSYLLNVFEELIQDKRFSDTKLLLVGDGAELDNLSNHVNKSSLKGSVEFLGNQVNPLPLLKRAKCLINTSLSEALPSVIIESIGLGIPVVASKTEGAKEVLENYESGFLVDLADKDLFLESVKKAINLEKIETSDYFLDKFSGENVVRKYIELL